MTIRYIVGVDEAGRGPLAGPVTVGACAACPAVIRQLKREIFPAGIRDSKKLTSVRREAILAILASYEKAGLIRLACVHSAPAVIDGRGISFALRSGIAKALVKISYSPAETEVRLDGLLRAPTIFKYQKTIVKGDEKEVIIALASIVAKVRRDRLMVRLARRYPGYDLEQHKGYGTRRHYYLIKKYGPSAAHRRSFLK